jgi:hypothetical protein
LTRRELWLRPVVLVRVSGLEERAHARAHLREGATDLLQLTSLPLPLLPVGRHRYTFLEAVPLPVGIRPVESQASAINDLTLVNGIPEADAGLRQKVGSID